MLFSKAIATFGLLLDMLGIWVTFKDRLPWSLAFRQQNLRSQMHRTIRMIEKSERIVAFNDAKQFNNLLLHQFVRLYFFVLTFRNT